MIGRRHATGARAVAEDSAALAIGTGLSRASGLARMLVIPAVFGAHVVGDMFLAVNALPQTLFATFGGQALSSMLVPVIVRSLEQNPERANLLGRRALGTVSVVLSAFMVVGLVFHRAIAAALASGIEGATDDGAGAIAGLLILLMLPQVVLYGVVSVLVALQHARGQFLLPSAAPTIENLALVAALVVIANRTDLTEVTSQSTAILVALGMASTLALVLHVIVQAVGAILCGAKISPLAPKHEAELHALRGQVRSSLAWTLVIGPRMLGLVIAAGWAGVGAIQAFEVGILVGNLPTALIGYPIAAAILPRLAHRHEGSSAIAQGYSSARDLAAWVLIPMGVGLAVLSEPFGEVLAVGRFSTGDGPRLITYSVIGLALAAVSEATYEIARQATLAFGDIRGFTKSVWVRGAISLFGIPAVPILFDGAELLLALGIVVSISDIAALAVIDRPLRRLAESTNSLVRTLTRSIFAALGASLVGVSVASASTGLTAILTLLLSGLSFGLSYLVLAWLLSQRGAMLRDDLRAGMRSVHE